MIFQRTLLTFPALFFCVIASSCAPTIGNLDQYQKQFLSKTDFMPSKESLEGKLPKIAVFALEENKITIAEQSQLGSSIASEIENVLSENRLAELVDRKAVEKLQKEVALVEMSKTGSYKGPRVADYAISGVISNASFSNKYSSGSTYFNPRNGQFISIPPKFTYSSEVAGNIKVYELPSLAVIETIEYNGKEIRTENVQQNGGLSIGGIQIGGEQAKGIDRDDGLVRKAGSDAVDNIKVDIKNAFAKRGYILEKRVYGSKTIFKISLGSVDGIKHGDNYEVFSQYEVENPITNQTEIENRKIAKGTITDEIDPKTSWVVMEEKEKVNKIRLGDAVKMKYKKSSFAGFAKFLKNLLK